MNVDRGGATRNAQFLIIPLPRFNWILDYSLDLSPLHHTPTLFCVALYSFDSLFLLLHSNCLPLLSTLPQATRTSIGWVARHKWLLSILDVARAIVLKLFLVPVNCIRLNNENFEIGVPDMCSTWVSQELQSVPLGAMQTEHMFWTVSNIYPQGNFLLRLWPLMCLGRHYALGEGTPKLG